MEERKKEKKKNSDRCLRSNNKWKKKEVSIENDEFSDQTIHNETWTDSTKPTPVG